MTDPNAKNIGYPSQLAVFLASTGGGIIISVLVSGLIWLGMEGTAFPLKSEDLLQPRYYNVTMVLQAVTTFFIFFLPVVFFAAICYRKPSIFLGYNLRISYKQVLLVIVILLVSFPLDGSLVQLNKILPIPKDLALRFKKWEDAREAQEALLIQINSFSKYILSLFIIALLPAIFEETFFRAGLQNLLTRWFKGPWIAIIISSIIFSLVHISYYGFLVRFGLGMILGLVFYYSGSIWISILFHFLFNGLQVTALYMASSSNLFAKKDMDANFPLWIGLPALLLLYYLFGLFRKFSLTQLAVLRKDEPDEDIYDWTRNQPK